MSYDNPMDLPTAIRTHLETGPWDEHPTGHLDGLTRALDAVVELHSTPGTCTECRMPTAIDTTLLVIASALGLERP